MVNSRLAYFDCFSGASGDMILGALVDAGLPLDELRGELARLPFENYEVAAEPVLDRGLAGTRIVVRAGPDQPHRQLRDVLELIAAANFRPEIAERARRIFERLAIAEARVHGATPDEVHFHEVGAVDAIVDVVGAVVGLDRLGITAIYCSPLVAGRGEINAAHGRLPAPGPATVELLREANAPVKLGPDVGELLTPTGAAILTTLGRFGTPELRIDAVGYGFGQKQLPWANALRVMLGAPAFQPLEEAAGLQTDRVIVVETNVDDAPGELLGHAMSRLLAAGALDVYFTSIQMKKNRPATTISVLAPPGRERALAELLLAETGSLGVRSHEAVRFKLERWETTVETRLGPIRAKATRIGDRIRVAPEYEECRRLAERLGLPLPEVYAAVAAGRPSPLDQAYE